MLLSRSAQYAMELVLYMLERPDTRFFRANEVADQLGLSAQYLSKIGQTLVKTGILNSARGPKGGFEFRKDPNKLTQLEIIQAIEGDAMLNLCILRPDKCSQEKPCPLHNSWVELKHAMRNNLEAQTLRDILNRSKS